MKSALSALALAIACASASPALGETAKPVAAASAAALDAYFEGVEKAAPSAPLAAEADYRAFAQALGDRAQVAYGSFATEGAGAVARDVVVTFGGDKKAGVRMTELRLHALALVKGDIVADRIEARGLSSFGLETLIKETTNAYSQAIIDGVRDATGEDAAPGAEAALAAGTEIEAYEFRVDRVVFDGAVFHAPDKAAGASAADDFGAMLRGYAAMGRAISARAIVSRGLSATFSSSNAGAKSAMTFSVPFYAQRGVARGDVDASVLTGLTFSLDGTSAATQTAPAIPVAMSGGVGRYSITGLKLARLLDYWARGESPPPKETNLLSLGVWESENERYTLGGKPFYSLDYARTDLSNFRWFLPLRMSSTVRNLTYDIGGLMRFSAETAPQAEGAADLKTMIALLDKHGFSTISASGGLDYEWAPQTGVARIVNKNDVKTLGRIDLDASAGLPTFKDFAALHPKKGDSLDTAKLSALFADASLGSVSFTVADAGMLPRMFAFAADMQAAQMGAAPGAVKPEELRAGAAFSLRTLGAAPTPLAPVYAAVADFVAEGGVLDLAANPAKPIPFSLIMAPGPDGEDPLTRLNITARRSPN